MQITSIALWLALLFFRDLAAANEASPPVEQLASRTTVATQARAPGAPSPSGIEQQTKRPEETLPFKAEHPGDTALSQDEDGHWRFRSFPALANLYVYAKDEPGKSNCRAPCTSAWIPLLATSTQSKQIGDWTLTARPDGRAQWAYKGRPVYLRYHDLAADEGNIERQGFRKLEP